LDIQTDSAGTAGYHVGSKPDHRMIETAAKFGVDISDLRARQFQASDFKEFDFIFAMDKENQLNIQKLASNDWEQKKVKLLLEHVNYPNFTEVPDPYYGSMNEFEFVFQMLDAATDKFITDLTKI